MNYELLLRVVEELSPLISGARLDRVLQGKDGNIYLVFRKDRKSHMLFLSPERGRPRLHLMGKKPVSAADLHPMVLQLRSRLVGGRLESISLLNEDRVACLKFSREGAAFSLLFELTGSTANLFFCDSGMRVLALYYPFSGAGQQERILTLGSRYVLPEKRNRAVAPPAAAPLLSSPNEEAERLYEQMTCDQNFRSLQSELRAAARRVLSRIKRKRSALDADLQALGDGELNRFKGECVLANISGEKKISGPLEVTGPHGEHLTVPIDPRLTLAGNAEQYFKKYKKAKAGRPLIVANRERLEKDEQVFQIRLQEIEQAKQIDQLLPIQTMLRTEGHLNEKTAARGSKDTTTPTGVRKVIVRGWEILIGRNAAGNDLITTKLARPDDLWLHAEGLPGSHVLVKNPHRKDIPPAILLAAAGLAARYSRGKGEGKVPVAYCEARYVSKPKGAKPGLVALLRRKTVVAEPRDDSETG